VAMPGPLAVHYIHYLGLIFVIWMTVVASQKLKSVEPSEKKQIKFVTAAVLLFVFCFGGSAIITTWSLDVPGGFVWLLGQYALLVLPVILVVLALLMSVQELKVTYAAAVRTAIIGLFVAVIALLLVTDDSETRPLMYLVLTLVMALGYFQYTSVRIENEQSEELERLAKNLKSSNRRLRKLNKLKSEFVSMTSHQLRSPLTAIRGYSSMLLEGSFGRFPKRAEEAIERIEDSSKFMAITIDDYLNMARLENGNMKYNLMDINIRDLAEQMVDDMRPVAVRKGLVMTLKTDLKSKAIVNVDSGKIRQIIHNLLDNALKFTSKGMITVFVHDDKRKKKIYVEVIDTGIGVSDNMMDNIFEKFERGDSKEVEAIHGSGLGLYTARTMAAAMNGDIIGHSEGEGKGSNFALILPLQM